MYKKSAYKIYFLERHSPLFRKQNLFSKTEINKFKRSHFKHYQTLQEVERVLKKLKIRCRKRCRGRKINFDAYDFVVTVGGDGTFLEAARGLKDQIILGVNSDPLSSVGRFCAATKATFPNLFQQILHASFKMKILPRIQLRLKLKNKTVTMDVLNDILICHQNPAAMSRYELVIHGLKEEQRSSGLWISTAAGSSGAIHSAGGVLMPADRQDIQYRPRELYQSQRNYQLKGGMVRLKSPFIVRSLMRGGVIFVDGSHSKYPFNFGDTARIAHSPVPLRVVDGGKVAL